MNARITGVGAYLPEQIMTNHDLEKRVDTSDAWIVERTGIRERRIAADGETSSSMATHAARAAIRAAGISEKDIDLIFVATTTPDMAIPSTACLVQGQLNAKGAAAFDLSAACSGFLFGLSIAQQYIRNGTARTILLIGSEVMSRIVNWSDRNTCILFGDGAGAVILQPTSDEDGVLSTHIQSDGQYWDLIRITGEDLRTSKPVNGLTLTRGLIEMKGSETFKVAVRSLEESAHQALKSKNLKPSDIDWVIPHQANIRILKAVAERMEWPLSKIVLNLDRYGNTSAASIPIAIDEAVQKGLLKKGHLVLLMAFGAGLTWSSAVIRW